MSKTGKPQKSHRHKKIKAASHYDPESFRTKHYTKKDQNLAPTSKTDEQHIPRSVRELMRLKQTGGLQQDVKKRRKKRAGVPAPVKGETRPAAPPVKFKKRNDESEYQFRYRMETACQNVIAQTQLEKKWKMQIESVDSEGQVKVKKSKTASIKAKARLQKLAERKGQKKKEIKTEQEEGFAKFSDKVEFGEVVLAPPSLTAKPRKAHRPSADKFKRCHSGLLLSQLLEGGAQLKKDGSAAGALKRDVGKTLPRKQLTPLQQQQHDRARDDAVARYRALKEARYAARSAAT